MPFKPGQSGNPNGSKAGVERASVKMRRAIEAGMPDIIAAMLRKAKEGDVAAAKLLVDRVLPILRPVGLAISMPEEDVTALVGGSLAERGHAVWGAMVRGVLDTDTAIALLAALSSQTRIMEADDFAKRLDSLERLNAERKQ
ncbi:MAG: DUF5681 domain-containing protein [Gammaproteobacteria bacterium]